MRRPCKPTSRPFNLPVKKFEKACPLLDKVAASGVSELADRAKVHLKVCHLQMEPVRNSFGTPEEHYDFAISLMNDGDFVGAREHLRETLHQEPVPRLHLATALPCWNA